MFASKPFRQKCTLCYPIYQWLPKFVTSRIEYLSPIATGYTALCCILVEGQNPPHFYFYLQAFQVHGLNKIIADWQTDVFWAGVHIIEL